MKRLLVIQYAGDYRAAYRLWQASGTETYYGHGYVLNRLEHFAREYGDAGVLCCRAPERYIERMPSGIMTMGANMRPGLNSRAILRMVSDYAPTHLLVHGPMPHFLRWGVRQGLKTMAMFADSFNTQPIKRLVKHGRIEQQLNCVGIDWVGNHGINASLSLARLGVDRRKIIPWDWPHDHNPDGFSAKAGWVGSAGSAAGPELLYVGYISQAKGVGDAIAAVAALKKRGQLVTLSIVGGGNRASHEKLAANLGVTAEVQFLGLIPNTEVLGRMREAAVVLVPSRHEFPEGLPLTIYEALRSRTPIVASDHPMFTGNLINQESALIFPARDVERMADCISQLLADKKRYARLSHNSSAAWRQIQIDGKWGDIIEHWLRGKAGDEDWLARRSLDGGLYAKQLQVR